MFCEALRDSVNIAALNSLYLRCFMRQFDFDAVIVGSGCAGLTAAIVAAHAGLRVLLVEKTSKFGGTSAWSGGGCWIPVNPMMPNLGVQDSSADAENYITGVVGNKTRRDLLNAFLKHGNAMLDFLVKKTEVKFFARTPAPDWRQDIDGAMIGGRALASPLYDGRLLGKVMLKKLQRPLTSFNAPMGMMMSPLDLDHVMKMFRSFASFKHVTGVMTRYAVDLVRFGRGSRLAMGNALVARLLRSAMDAGVELWSDTKALNLVQADGRVSGLLVERDGETMQINAAKGVVLASGGFAADKLMRARFFTTGAGQTSLTATSNTGDGITMAERAGAAIEENNHQPAAWDFISTIPGRTDPDSRCLHAFRDLPKPGVIVVGPDGQRFGNEAALLANAAVDRNITSAWIICDHGAMTKNGVGMVWPFGLNLPLMKLKKYVLSDRTIGGLAKKINLDPIALEATVQRFNGNAIRGEDPDFGRGQSVLDQVNGDPSHKPNASLGPLAQGPFYAVRVVLSDVGSVTGLRVDQAARVCRTDDSAIPGLYACGIDMNALWAGAPIGLGMNHGHNMTFAYIASRHMAGQLD